MLARLAILGVPDSGKVGVGEARPRQKSEAKAKSFIIFSGTNGMGDKGKKKDCSE